MSRWCLRVKEYCIGSCVLNQLSLGVSLMCVTCIVFIACLPLVMAQHIILACVEIDYHHGTSFLQKAFVGPQLLNYLFTIKVKCFDSAACHSGASYSFHCPFWKQGWDSDIRVRDPRHLLSFGRLNQTMIFSSSLVDMCIVLTSMMWIPRGDPCHTIFLLLLMI